jgi:hypothetical protein
MVTHVSPTAIPQRPALAVAAGALLLAPSLLPAVAAGGEDTMSDGKFEAELDEARSQVEAAVDAYRNGDRGTALEKARAVEDRFTFGENETTAFEGTIREKSATSVAERVKALASKLESRIAANASVEEVQNVADDLSPSLNRLVLVAKGKAAPASGRTLRSEKAIEDAIDEVLSKVDEAVSLYEDGDSEAARAAAKDAFFLYESNGLGPDVTTVDKALEDRTEFLIVNFQGEEPGLAGLIEQGAQLEDVRDQRDAIASALAENEEVLKATLPPASLGDANTDGKVDVVDALLVAQAALGVRQQTDTMDANQDGDVSIVDALLVSQAALGIRTI